VDVRIREAPLPGIGYRCELALDRNCRLFVVVQRSGERELGIMRAGADEPEAVVSLTNQAVALSALLSGARLSVDKAEGDQAEANVVAVHTVTLGPSSPAVGLRMREIPLPADDDTAILAVIRDTTAELIEDESTAPIQPGDRLVLAARRANLAELVRTLTG